MFYTDQPICSARDDLLGRGPFAKRLAHSILHFDPTDSYAVALQGRWGCGKTSVLNMALEEIRRAAPETGGTPDVIVVRFHPWNFTEPAQLINQFFVTLTNTLKIADPEKRLQSLGAVIEGYSDALEYAEYIPVVGPYLKLLPKLTEQLGKTMRSRAEARINDAAYQKSLVEQALRDCGKRILIVIDDIDRLPNEQIRLIFQLVNSVAGFPHTTYLLAFDKEIVTRALGTVHDCDGAAYLEKIIQVSFDLPPLREDRLHAILLERLYRIAARPEGQPFDAGRWSQVFDACIAPFIGSLRDVNRFCNTLSFAYSAVREETDFIDMAGICALQVFAPPVFEWIRTHKHTLTGGYPGGGIPLNGVQERWQDALETFRTVWPAHPDGMRNAVSSLFPAFSNATSYSGSFQTPSELHQAMRIAAEDRFDLYFSLSPEEVAISRAALDDSLLHMDEAQWQAYLASLAGRGLLFAYLRELSHHVSRLPEERAALAAAVLLSQAQALRQAGPDGTDLLSARLLPELLLRIDDGQARLAVLSGLFRSAELPAFQVLSALLQRIEITHDRIPGASLSDSRQLIAADALPQLEALFLARLQHFMQTSPVLDWEDAVRYLLLWRLADADSFASYTQSVLADDLTAAKFLSLFVCAWRDGRGAVAAYSRAESVFGYSAYIDAEAAVAKIDRARQAEAFWSAGTSLPERAAAFVLLASRGNPLAQADVREVRETVRAWRAELAAPSADAPGSADQTDPAAQ